jgi:hypothetical protein
MGLVEDQKPVEQLAAQGADQSFADRVGLRGLCGAGDDLHAVGGERGVKRGGELGVAISDHKAQFVQPSARVIGQVPSVWVPKISVPSGDLLIFVDQAADQADASHLLRWWSGGVVEPVGWSLAEGAVWPMSVVVPEVGSQDRGQMAAAKDEDPVGAFAPDRADPAFGESVRAGRAYRRADDRDLFRGEHGIETGDELGVAIADQETQLFDPVIEIHQQIASLLGHPRPGRVGRDAREVHPAGADFDEE